MNDESGLVLLVGGGLVGVQFVHQGGWAALESKIFHTDPGARGNSVLAQDKTGHHNFMVLVGQVVILAILYVVADQDPDAGAPIIWFLGALWLVFLVMSGWGAGALTATTQQFGL
jgi:hypothetical protein